MVDEGAVLIDVRRPDGHAAGYFGPATNISHDLIVGTPEGMAEVHKLTGNDKTKAIVVIRTIHTLRVMLRARRAHSSRVE